MAAGALDLCRRHLRPIWVQGSIGVERVRRGLHTTNWTGAAETIHGWQVTGRAGVRRPDVPTIAEAVTTTIRTRRELLVGKRLPYCTNHGYRQLRDRPYRGRVRQ